VAIEALSDLSKVEVLHDGNGLVRLVSILEEELVPLVVDEIVQEAVAPRGGESLKTPKDLLL